MKHNSQETKEKAKDHFEKMSLDYSNTFAGKFSDPMRSALIQELNGKSWQCIKNSVKFVLRLCIGFISLVV